MPAGLYNFEIEQGSTLDKVFLWKDPLGNPINLSGYSARMQVRSKVTSEDVLLELTTENGGITLGGGQGTITLHFTEANTSPMPKGGVYDLELIIDGKPFRFIQGNISLSKQVTRNV